MPDLEIEPRTAPLRDVRALMFDLDGTLADTEPLWIAAKERVAGRHDIVWTDADAAASVGQPTTVYAGEFVRRGATGGVAGVAQEITLAVAAALADGVAWRPGALRLLQDAVSVGIPTALVTMAYRPIAVAIADATGLDVFDVIVAGDDVANSKPHPEPYEKALRALGVRAEHAVAIEDTDTGARSASSHPPPAARPAPAAAPRTVLVPSGTSTVRHPSIRVADSLERVRLR